MRNKHRMGQKQEKTKNGNPGIPVDARKFVHNDRSERRNYRSVTCQRSPPWVARGRTSADCAEAH